jgi:hypothetical protein
MPKRAPLLAEPPTNRLQISEIPRPAALNATRLSNAENTGQPRRKNSNSFLQNAKGRDDNPCRCFRNEPDAHSHESEPLRTVWTSGQQPESYFKTFPSSTCFDYCLSFRSPGIAHWETGVRGPSSHRGSSRSAACFLAGPHARALGHPLLLS